MELKKPSNRGLFFFPHKPHNRPMWSLRILLTLLLLSACQIYRSSGRNDFESHSPFYIINNALIGCEEAQVAEADEIISHSFFQNETHAVADKNSLVRVLRKIPEQICHYEFATTEEWQTYKTYFLENLN